MLLLIVLELVKKNDSPVGFVTAIVGAVRSGL